MWLRGLVVSILCVGTLVSCGERKIVHNLSELEANKLIVRLNRAGIQAEKSSDDNSVWSVQVPASRVSDALVVAEDLKLRRTGTGLKDLNGLFSSREQREFAVQTALSRSLEDSFLVLPGVREAKVHLNLPPKDSMLRTKAASLPGSASVLIMKDSAFGLNQTDIKSLVAGATGLSPDVVSVWLMEPSLGSPPEPDSGVLKRDLLQEAPRELWKWNSPSWLVAGGAIILMSLLLILRIFSSRPDDLPTLEL
jgi:type III secretory pathway lipoprotein EscJ